MLCRLFILIGFFVAVTSVAPSSATEISDTLERLNIEIRNRDYVGALESLDTIERLISEKAPIHVVKAIFVEEAASGFGQYDERKDSVFLEGEKFHVYLEPRGVDFEGKPGAYVAQMSIDARLFDDERRMIAEVAAPKVGRVNI